MLAEVECDECLFIKARLLEIILNYDEAVDELNAVINFDWRAKKAPIQDAILHFAKASPNAAEISTVVEGIESSMIW